MRKFFAAAAVTIEEPVKEITLLLFSVFLFATAFGIDVVTFPTVLSQHVSPTRIGFAFTCELFGIIVMSFFLAKIVARFGTMKALSAAAFSYATAISLIYFYQNFFLWITIAFGMGFCWLTYTITRQSWLNSISSNQNRGIILGFFSMAISAGMAVGPIIASFSGITNYRTFLLSSIIVLLSYCCLLPIKNKAPSAVSAKRISLKKFFQKNPRCFLGRFFLDFQSYFLITFSVIYAKTIGLSYEQGAFLISIFMASGFFDVIVGFALRQISPYRIMLIGFLIYMYCFIFLILIHSPYWLLLTTYFILGIGVACIYVSVFKIANDDYSREELVAANSTFQIIGSIGSLFGAAIGGFFIDTFGTNGFPVIMILGSATYLSILVFHEKKS
jgi:MFS family permease